MAGPLDEHSGRRAPVAVGWRRYCYHCALVFNFLLLRPSGYRRRQIGSRLHRAVGQTRHTCRRNERGLLVMVVRATYQYMTRTGFPVYSTATSASRQLIYFMGALHCLVIRRSIAVTHLHEGVRPPKAFGRSSYSSLGLFRRRWVPEEHNNNIITATVGVPPKTSSAHRERCRGKRWQQLGREKKTCVQAKARQLPRGGFLTTVYLKPLSSCNP